MNASQPPHHHVPDDDEHPHRVPPGLVVLVLAILLLAAIIIGVMRNRESGPGIATLTVAELRADPDRWDTQTVELVGQAEGIRELPLLSQYALYTFRDDTGTIQVLSQHGAPPSSVTGQLRLRGIYHSRVRLDSALKTIVEEQLGPVAGSLVSSLVPGIPLNVVYLEHKSYEISETNEES